MAKENALPRVFAHRERGPTSVPWISLPALSLITLSFVNLADLTAISSFASATFLLIFASINLSVFRLREKVGAHPLMPLVRTYFPQKHPTD